MTLVNKAYAVETGNTGISFKNADRYREAATKKIWSNYVL